MKVLQGIIIGLICGVIIGPVASVLDYKFNSIGGSWIGDMTNLAAILGAVWGSIIGAILGGVIGWSLSLAKNGENNDTEN